MRSGYRPQFYVRTTDVPGVLGLGAGASARPGETVQVTVTLGQPVAIREGGRTVGAGTVTGLLD